MIRGDVVIVDVAFVGVSGSKKRPALIFQNDQLNAVFRETVIVPITSNLSQIHQPDQLLIDISTREGALSGLSMNSAVRCSRLHTIPQSDVRSVFSHLPDSLMRKVDQCLISALGIET